MKIVIAYDGSTYSEAGIENLRWAGLAEDCEALIVSAVESNSSHQWMMDMKAALQAAESAGDRLQTSSPNGRSCWKHLRAIPHR
jgi:hypothetical protein